MAEGHNLQDKSREELAEMAKDIPGIAGSKMNKEELIKAIEQHKSSKHKK